MPHCGAVNWLLKTEKGQTLSNGFALLKNDIKILLKY